MREERLRTYVINVLVRMCVYIQIYKYTHTSEHIHKYKYTNTQKTIHSTREKVRWTMVRKSRRDDGRCLVKICL